MIAQGSCLRETQDSMRLPMECRQDPGPAALFRGVMARYTLRAVSRDPDGKVTDVTDSWSLNALSPVEAKAEADSQRWGKAGTSQTPAQPHG